VDPPYMPAVRTTGRCYDNEMSFPDWEALAKALDSCEGKVAVSTYDHPSLDRLFPCDRWLMSLEGEQAVHGGAKRQECLLTNYDPRGV
jgi:site-specific DNA-adenine methylase